jgi:hypothetical protein
MDEIKVISHGFPSLSVITQSPANTVQYITKLHTHSLQMLPALGLDAQDREESMTTSSLFPTSIASFLSWLPSWVLCESERRKEGEGTGRPYLTDLVYGLASGFSNAKCLTTGSFFRGT